MRTYLIVLPPPPPPVTIATLPSSFITPSLNGFVANVITAALGCQNHILLIAILEGNKSGILRDGVESNYTGNNALFCLKNVPFFFAQTGGLLCFNC